MASAGTASAGNMFSKAAGLQSLIVFVVLALAWVVGFSSRLFAVIRFESIIHEFDPWFNYRSTHYMTKHGFYDFLNWFDERAWYPLGRIVGGTVYPGLMVTSGSIQYVLSLLNIPVHIRDVCVFLAPIFSGLTAIATYLLTKEIWSTSAGLLAGSLICIVPGYISRSVAGSYDNEGIAIFALMFTYYLWIKSVKTGSVFWAICTALSYFYMVSAWGGYVFIINLIPLHSFVLVLIGRYSSRLYIAYCTFYVVGTILAMQIPFVGFQPIRTSEHMAAAGTFIFMNLAGTVSYLYPYVQRVRKFGTTLIYTGVILAVAVLVLGVAYLTYAGYVAPWSGRFYSLYDTGYAKVHIPIIASVSEHQPTTWVSFLFDLHILSCAFPAGVWFVMKNMNDERALIILYALTAVYFAGVMVRLMLTLTPIVCVFSAIAFSHTFEKYVLNEPEESSSEEEEGSAGESSGSTTAAEGRQLQQEGIASALSARGDKKKKVQPATASSPFPKKGKKGGSAGGGGSGDETSDGVGNNLRGLVLTLLSVTLLFFVTHCTWVTSNAYSSPSIVLASHNSDGSRNILDDFRESYFWLRQNTGDDARVMSWWDYGYQIAGMANRTTLVDNNTWNNSHIALVGKAMSSNETAAYKIMQELNVDYVLVIFGGVIGYSGDDINKFLWMVRIAEGEHPTEIRESDYFTPNGEFRVDASGSKTMLNCLMYKLCYYRFGEVQMDPRAPSGFDRTRNVEIGNKDIGLEHLEEAYTSEHWLVRIYRVLPPANRHKRIGATEAKGYKPTKKKSGSRKGKIRTTSHVVKGTRRKSVKK